MGVREWIRLAAKLVNQLAPDVTTVTEACRRGFDVSRTATAQVDGAVRTKVREVHDYLTDDQLRHIVGRYAKHLSKNGVLYVVSSYGAGPIIDIVSQSMQDNMDESQKERIQQLEIKVAELESVLSSVKILDETEIEGSSMPSKTRNKPDFNMEINQNPEAMLRVLLMKELGSKILDDLIIPHPGSRRR